MSESDSDPDWDEIADRGRPLAGLLREKEFWGIIVPIMGLLFISWKIGERPGQLALGISLGVLFAITSGIAFWWLFWCQR